ncbi:PQQ-binding-like beta-propeller repeat protein [Gemmata sp. JC717]|uniref:PQQ-binding-like beta-propeller repeat protein n=1 Tax=Gemmata algarum TaxID=2975278 RepID=A0ABU5F7R5_9BACT|nr:PQQ-binding-like beta-propeller repeat protein [Gemmata algarum]MDY3553165.1 PQQ-binding-like beta-propeller repeat protein [Gemmata algarum]MDY3562827.1 PQQ-binding-like beta-propeller repeat protein [Gemmata algarum]
MKARTILLVTGVAAVIAVAVFVAARTPWVRSWFARNSENPAEIERATNAALTNHRPADAAAGYPQWRGAGHAGVAPAGSFRTDWDQNPPKQLWRTPVGGGYGSCAVVGGRLYVQDRQGENERVVCLDAETGRLVWEHSYPSGQAGKDRTYAIGPRATPTVTGNWVFTVGGAGKLLAIEVTGDRPGVRWEHDLIAEFNADLPQWGVACSPLLLDEMVVVQPGGKGAAVVAFDKASGAVKWRAGSNPPGYSSPVAATIGGLETVFAFLGDALLAVRASDGKVMSEYKWETEYKGNIATPLVIDNEYVFISSAYNMGCALLRAERKGDEVALVRVYEQRRSGFANHHATSVYKDKHLFGIDGTQGSGGLKCVALMTGKAVPDWEAREIGQASLILAGEHLILQTARGDLCLVEASPKEYTLVSRLKKVLTGNNNWATPTLVNGRLYVRDEEKVICFDVRP